ncbi:hypothetical protein SAMN04488598_10690 [Halanaerobium congolense]|jgi:hypothetical protein|uniref:SWIM-type domain-containing protein n=2 Tax=Halanaerobium congolense TaxID=54121 RepID=A0A1M7N5D5_9FIRM|nr:hypothetical protein [Halanaerobium congolense]PTX17304.1 hypothetical protein C7953_2078 [Halanaerobium congolense]SDF12205.1 hypothetical protein SAMN04488598_10690 [Halanaerobium congolense]SES81571.1 hypothetical protein SAMN04515652_10713 [Halanaerobium congolense]SFO98117.1 hypothetical protein SAMN04488596_103168 [Halanaerobium congolense]SHM98798.1 hypothetical protein SAMN04515650_11528 [Halanaerobium congolense]
MSLSIEDLEKMAAEQSFQKGINYYQMNLVNNPLIDGNTIKAEVSGSSFSLYDVEMNIDDPSSNHCSCPYDWGGICKHLVALGLYWCNDKEAFRKVKKEKAKLKNELDQLFKSLTREELTELLGEFVYENDNSKSKVLNFIQDKGKMSNELYLEKLKSLKNQAFAILMEFNQYGGGPINEENNFFEFINGMEKLINKLDIPSSLRHEIINEFMGEYLIGNSGLDDPTLDIVYSTARNKDDWELIIQHLKKSGSRYDQELIMKIYLNKLHNEEKYLKLRKKQLKYGMDYYKLACYYQDIDQEEKAVQIALKGEKEGEGRIIDNITFLKKYYQKQNNYQKTLEYLIKEYKESPSFEKYLSVLDNCKKDDKKQIKNDLISYLKESKYSRYNNELALIYESQKNYEEILKLVMANKIYPDNFSELLINKFPHEMIDYYSQKVQGYINNKNRSSYQSGAQIALIIKEIYTKILKSSSKWEDYIQNILEKYPRHPALQEEFKKIF